MEPQRAGAGTAEAEDQRPARVTEARLAFEKEEREYCILIMIARCFFFLLSFSCQAKSFKLFFFIFYEDQ